MSKNTQQRRGPRRKPWDKPKNKILDTQKKASIEVLEGTNSMSYKPEEGRVGKSIWLYIRL